MFWRKKCHLPTAKMNICIFNIYVYICHNSSQFFSFERNQILKLENYICWSIYNTIFLNSLRVHHKIWVICRQIPAHWILGNILVAFSKFLLIKKIVQHTKVGWKVHRLTKIFSWNVTKWGLFFNSSLCSLHFFYQCFRA